METHELAKYFPLLEGEEFDLLVEDIKQNGQLETIIMVDGQILDGVNRWRACEKLGIQPLTEQYKGDDPLSYVISLNIRRRHLDKSQRAMLATEMLPEFEKEAEKRRLANLKQNEPIESNDSIGRSDHLAAKQFGISGPTVQRAKRIKEQAPEKVNDVIKGKISVYQVDEELRRKQYEEDKKKRPPKDILDITLEARRYYDGLMIALNHIPKQPPKELTERDLLVLTEIAKKINERIRYFLNGKTEEIISKSD